MSECIETPTTVCRYLVPEGQRLSHVERLFGVQFPLQLEPFIYAITKNISADYRGGFWKFYTLDNGGFYMAPDDDKLFAVQCDNFYQGMLSSDALGIVSCLTAYSHLSFGGRGNFPRECARHFHLLRHYMYDHAEVAAILGAID